MSPRHLFLVLLGLYCAATANLLAQDDVLDLMGGSAVFAKHLPLNASGGAFVVQVVDGGTPVTDITWTACVTSSSTPCTPDTGGERFAFGNGLTITFDSGNGRATLDGNSSVAGDYNVTLQAQHTSSNSMASRTYQFTVREPLQLLFVVDRSGSMECQPNAPGSAGDWPDCRDDAAKKWLMAQDAVERFAVAMDETPHSFVDDDAVGVVYFDGAIGSSTLSSAASPFTSVSTLRGGVVADFNGQFDSDGHLGVNGTGLGAGLDEGANHRFAPADAASRRQVLLLVSDGQQNVSPRVVEAGPDVGQVLDDAAATSLNNDPTVANALDVYSLGFDSDVNAGSVGYLLSRISTDPSQNYFYTTSVGNYTPAFDEIFSRVFQLNTPQMVAHSPQWYSGSMVSDTVEVNSGVQMLYFNVSFATEQANRMNYTLTHNGDTLTGIEPVLGRFSASVVVNQQQLPDRSTAGQWILYCQRQPVVDVLDQPPVTDPQNIEFISRQAIFTTTVDEHRLKADYSVANDPTILQQGRIQVGTRLRPMVTLALAGQPLENATVRARLVRPNDDKGDLVARHPATAEVKAGSEINNLFTAKYRAIASTDPAYLDSLRRVSDEIELTHTTNGQYVGRFDRLKVADNCSVVFTIEAKDTDGSPIYRYNRISVASRFGDLDHNLAAHSATTSAGDNGFRHTLDYTPAYRVGNRVQLVGPGYTNSFGIEGGELNNVVDQGDGRYTLQVTTPARNSRPTLYLSDEPFYQGRPLTHFDQPYVEYPLDVSLHLGLSGASTATTALFSDPGLMVELDVAYRVLPRIGLELIGGYYTLAPVDDLIGGGLHARYHSPPLGANNGIGLTVAVGAGTYRPNLTGTWTTGYGFRVGAEQQFNSRLRFTLDTGYYRLPSPNVEMTIAALGVKYGL